MTGLPAHRAKFLLFLLPAAFLLFHLNDVPFVQTADVTDLLVSHYPNGLLIQQTFARWHTIPLWSPAILSGYPFAADPLSGLYYLPGMLALLFPLPLGFNLMIIAHLVFGGLGMYALLRAEGLCEAAAMLGGLSFAALPKLYSHLGAGHLTLLYAIAWTPWLLWAENKKQTLLGSEPFPFRHSALYLLPGLVLGITALADIRWAAYAGLLWVAYALRLALIPCSGLPARSRWLVGLLVNGLMALLVAAPLLLPLAEYTRLATRSALTPADNQIFSLPPAGLLGLVYPTFPGTVETVLYPGAVVAALVLLSLCVPTLRRWSSFWLCAAGVTLVIALGANLPFGDWVARVPGINLLRVPSRALFITGMAFCAVAGYAVEYLLEIVERAHRASVKREDVSSHRSALVLFGMAVFVVLFGLLAMTAVPKPLGRFLFGWGSLFALAGFVLVGLARAGHLRPQALVVLLFSACLADTISINALLLAFKPAASVFATSQPVIQAVQADGGSSLYRVYSPSYSIGQHAAAAASLELADGVDPLQLKAYVRFMSGQGGATGVPNSGYSVTMPPHPGDDPATDTQEYLPNAAKLGLLNVRYVVSAFPISAPGLSLLERVGTTYIYNNRLALPRAWVQSSEAEPGQQIRSVAQVTARPDHVGVAAQGPGLLVLSELAYPGWQVTVDGRSARIETVGGLLRGVQIGAGAHDVAFDFRPLTVYAGLVIAALAWAGWVIAFVILRKSQHG